MIGQPKEFIMSLMRKVIALTSGAIVAVAISAATAQQSQQPSQVVPMMGGPMTGTMGEHGMMGMMGSSGMMPMMGQGMMCGSASHVEGRLAYLKAELRITDAQAPQWDAFADAFRANAQKMGQRCATMMGQGGGDMMMSMMTGTLPERLDRMEQHMTLHLEALRAMKTAVQPLYAALNDEQKRMADQIIHGPMMM
jgi:hypothetical protein